MRGNSGSLSEGQEPGASRRQVAIEETMRGAGADGLHARGQARAGRTVCVKTTVCGRRSSETGNALALCAL